MTWAGMSWAAMAWAHPSARRLPDLLEVLVGVGGEDLGERRQSGRGRQRVPVERPLLGDALADLVHEVGAAAEGAGRYPSGDRLGEARQVGLDPEALDGPARRDGGAALHLVEDEHDAVAGAQLAYALEIAGPRQHDADVHHHGLEDEAGDLVAALGEEALEGAEVVVGDDQGPLAPSPAGMPFEAGGLQARLLGGLDEVEAGGHREHDGVVMAVVRRPRSCR